METTAIEGATSLLDYGVLGLFLLLCLGALVYVVRYLKDIVSIIIKDKDEQIDKRDKQLDGVLDLLAQNSTRLIELYAHQQKIIEEIPDRTVDKIRLSRGN
jgi:hypothetical protein